MYRIDQFLKNGKINVYYLVKFNMLSNFLPGKVEHKIFSSNSIFNNFGNGYCVGNCIL